MVLPNTNSQEKPPKLRIRNRPPSLAGDQTLKSVSTRTSTLGEAMPLMDLLAFLRFGVVRFVGFRK